MLKELKVSLSILASGIINVNWTYTNATGMDRQPFEVPLSIVDPKKDALKEGAKLSDFVTIQQDTKGPFTLTIMNSGGTPIYTLNGMILSEYLNIISSTVHTHEENF